MAALTGNVIGALAVIAVIAAAATALYIDALRRDRRSA